MRLFLYKGEYSQATLAHSFRRKTISVHSVHIFLCKEHLSTNSGEKHFSCDQCDYLCNHAWSLKGHKQQHSGEKPYACNQCSFSCSYLSGLKYHKLSLTGEKLIACKEMQFLLPNWSNMNYHMLSNTGKKPFCLQEMRTLMQAGSWIGESHEKAHIQGINTSQMIYFSDIDLALL